MNLHSGKPVAAGAADPGVSYVNLNAGRVEWVDYLKGFCILLVVMMHAVLGVEKAAGAEGWMHVIVSTVQPLRMPAFFLASGLFLMRGIDASWKQFADRKIVHFAYFYVLWLAIQFVFKAPGMVAEDGVAGAAGAFALSFVQPFGTLWFIYILPIFYLATRLTRHIAPVVMVLAAAFLQVLPIHTGATLIDEFASYFLWFYLGYAFAPRVFGVARWAADNPAQALVAAALVLAGTWYVTSIDVLTSSLPADVASLTGQESIPLSMMPVVSLVLGGFGTLALVAVSAVLAQSRHGEPIRWCGAHSIVIYLAFFLPMAVTRTVLLKLGIISDVGTMSLIVWTAAIAGPVILFFLIDRTGLGRFLFERPSWAVLKGTKRSEAAASA